MCFALRTRAATASRGTRLYFLNATAIPHPRGVRQDYRLVDGSRIFKSNFAYRYHGELVVVVVQVIQTRAKLRPSIGSSRGGVSFA